MVDFMLDNLGGPTEKFSDLGFKAYIKIFNGYKLETLSLSGIRKTKRFQLITVKYLDISLKPQIGKFFGWTAQIIQHEIDHCNGIII